MAAFVCRGGCIGIPRPNPHLCGCRMPSLPRFSPSGRNHVEDSVTTSSVDRGSILLRLKLGDGSDADFRLTGLEALKLRAAMRGGEMPDAYRGFKFVNRARYTLAKQLDKELLIMSCLRTQPERAPS